MSEDVVIRVEKLGKKYVIGHESKREPYVALRDVLTRTARRFASSAMDLARGKPIVHGDTTEEFWALKDVSFEVKRGEVVGIIGRNGAGKSTLLKILSRITEPSEGRVCINGRVASLLEVGSGFHPELTGRENIYLNGAILGMTHSEIKQKFDEIIAFAEVSQFLDTPVKRYSSGMYVRLAFAIAAHLDSEILIVDEVLAVGDSEFQKKCLTQMGNATQHGRTVLFVSHNMQAVQTLCGKGMLLERGQVSAVGSVMSIVTSYLYGLEHPEVAPNHSLGPSLSLNRLSIVPETIASGSCARLVIELSVRKRTFLHFMHILIYSEIGVRVGILDLRTIGISNLQLEQGIFSVNLEVASFPLVEGQYRLGLYVFDSDHMNDYYDLAILRIVETPGRYQFVPSPPQYRGAVEFDFHGSFTSRSTPIWPPNAPSIFQ